MKISILNCRTFHTFPGSVRTLLRICTYSSKNIYAYDNRMIGIILFSRICALYPQNITLLSCQRLANTFANVKTMSFRYEITSKQSLCCIQGRIHRGAIGAPPPSREFSERSLWIFRQIFPFFRSVLSTNLWETRQICCFPWTYKS